MGATPIKMHAMKIRTTISLIAAAQWAFIPFVSAQDDAEEAYELSPFVVDSSSDTGYRATNTLAGSRLNTNLKDVPSSISVFTDIFIEDLGIQNLEELSNYTSNMTIDYGEDEVGGVRSDRDGTTATSATQRINIRGVAATQGMDFFRSITPSDGYRSGRYDSARGPNSILFGLSNAGGIVNSTSIGANTQQNSGRIRVQTEDTGGFRTDLRVNRVLIEDKLALSIATVDQEAEEWQVNTFDDIERIFGTVTYKANENVTFRANYESGTQRKSNQTRAPALDFGGVPLYDWTQYLNANGGDLDTLLGTSSLTLARNNGNEGSRWTNAASEFFGTVQRNTNPRTQNRRYVFTTNDQVLYEDAGQWVFRGYGDQGVSAPPDANWTNGATSNGGRPRVNMPGVLPRTLNTDGTGASKVWNFENYTFFGDFKVNDNFFINVAHNYQKTDLTAFNIGGFAFQVNADANLTRGLDFSAKESFVQQVADGVAAPDRNLTDFDGSGGARNPNFGPNPYAGQWYLESNWRNDGLDQETEATRVSASYDLDTERFGQHRFAVTTSRTEEFSYRTNKQLGFLGRPFNTHWNNPGNRVEVRTYYDFDDPVQSPETFAVGSWETLHGTKHMIDGRELEIGWTNRIPGNGNKAGIQTIDSSMFAMQNFWFNRKLVTTVGIRKDKSDILQYRNEWSSARAVDLTRGITEDELLTGPMPDFEQPEEGDSFDFDSDTTTFGAVYNITDNFGLVANHSDSIGFPDFVNLQIPLGNPTPPPEGEGLDYGIRFNFLDNRISGRLVYYETDEIGARTGLNNNGQYDRLVDLASNVVDEGIMTQAAWDALDAEELYTRNWSADLKDKTTKGVELTMQANVTQNWRMTFNASKVDRVSTNTRKGMEAHYGFLPDPDSPLAWDQIINPFETTTSTTNTPYLQDRSGLAPGGIFDQLVGHLTSLVGTGAAGGATRWEEITTTGSNTAGRDMEIVLFNLNNTRKLEHKGWGLRPYRANWWNAYDFTEGRFKGLSVGAGISWQDNMIIGESDTTLETFTSRELWNTDGMIRYRWADGIGFLEGPFSVQLNISNLLDDEDIIPVSHQNRSGPIYEYPYGRGEVYSRYDVPQGRSWRLTATYEF